MGPSVSWIGSYLPSGTATLRKEEQEREAAIRKEEQEREAALKEREAALAKEAIQIREREAAIRKEEAAIRKEEKEREATLKERETALLRERERVQLKAKQRHLEMQREHDKKQADMAVACRQQELTLETIHHTQRQQATANLPLHWQQQHLHVNRDRRLKKQGGRVAGRRENVGVSTSVVVMKVEGRGVTQTISDFEDSVSSSSVEYDDGVQGTGLVAAGGLTSLVAADPVVGGLDLV
ncbi:MAP7 domain-containing protein 2-like [Procambarus clarkii]|uniref:MAP7 domain-containing protein 2-like n=1 Tax=Procambarus clarkii TaxID=6728 RepID=UPI0037437CC6